MKLHLAPMEGVVDFITRDFLTRIGGIDQCVTEFIRVTDHLIPDKVFFRDAPELAHGSRTAAGTPLFIQLLGGQPTPMAENAARAAELGALGIDLNFGCPAKTVNRHDGGAALLKCADRIEGIVSAVRRSVPAPIPVTAKIRLGFDEPSACLANAQAIESGGAQALTVHCRTKMDLYRPPAYWEWMPRLREVVKLPLIANGEIWTVTDFEKCRDITGCDHFMMGRGALTDPYLFARIRGLEVPQGWEPVRQLLADFFDVNERLVSSRFALARSKQWLRSLALAGGEARELFDQLKVVNDPRLFALGLKGPQNRAPHFEPPAPAVSHPVQSFLT